jgi:ABC-type multidrug transport system ATPase subunit
MELLPCVQRAVIGGAGRRGLSGGELKRASIGCEMLTDPSMILLDEPTSGLDSSSALILTKNLCRLAEEKSKVIIASIHQPSSQIYHMFDDLLLLAKGKVRTACALSI